MKLYQLLVLLLIVFCISCRNSNEIPVLILEGTWKGSSLKVGDSISKVDLTPVRLTFTKNSRYHYTNNIAQTEAGTYFINDSILITNDTTMRDNKETAVHVVKATKDSLILRMNMDSVETLMFFVK